MSKKQLVCDCGHRYHSDPAHCSECPNGICFYYDEDEEDYGDDR